MANNAGRLPFVGRAISSYQAQFDGELSLVAGDLVLVTDVRDGQWFYGKLGSSEGRFPRNNVTGPVTLPQAQPGQPYFATLAEFYEQESGDLSFKQGEILVGIRRIDDNWWYGRAFDHREGSFPLSYVWKIDIQRNQDNRTPLHFKRRRARAIQDLVPQLPEELDLRKGDEILVTGEAEDGWYYGECNGKRGTFPRGFVTLLPENEAASPAVLLQSNGFSNLKFNSNRPYGIALYDYRATHADELNLQTGQTVYLLRHVNDEWIEGEVTDGRKGMFPTSYVQIVNDCDRPGERISTQQPSKGFDLLLDFDPLMTGSSLSTLNHNSQWNSTLSNANTTLIDLAAPSGSRYMNLDNFITRNLNQFESNTQTVVKQRPSSWSQELTKLQIETFSRPTLQEQSNVKNELPKLPKIPPRLHEIQSFTQQEQEQLNELKQVDVPAVEQVLDVAEYANTIGNVPAAVGNVSEPEERISEMPNGGAVRRSTSYIRPAPPPPTQQSDSANPNFERQHSTGSNEGCLRPHRPAPCIPIDAGDERVEGRRKRAEIERMRKMEEDKLRDFEMRKKIFEQRQNVITELVVTEREYCRDLRLTCQVFHLNDPQQLEKKGIDVKSLFGNILEVIKLSESFIDQLSESTREGADPVVQSIGNCFVRNEPEFRRIYGQYCVSHENAQHLLERYESVPSINRILEEGILTLRQQIICFNMGSVIIKPVQRIMKYPLILNELIKSTENDHPDKNQLMVASSLMAAVATHINESKRKKEIVLKYRDTGLDAKLSQKISRLSIHSVAKKSSRLGMLLKTSLGMAPSTRDEAFEDIEARFNEMVRIVQTVLRDITAVSEQLKATSKCQFDISEAVASFYGEGSRLPVVDNFRTAHRIIYQQHWNSFENYVIQHVRNPLTALCDACAGPERLVGKRRDKLLDSNIASEKVAKNRDPALRRMLEEEENIARNTYFALNSQLMEELPIITEHGFNIYRRCLSSFLHARRLLTGRITKAFLDLNGMPDIANLDGEIESDFYAAHNKAVDHLSRVSFVSKSFRTNNRHSFDGSVSPLEVTPPRRAPLNTSLSPQAEGLVVQSSEAINLLRTKYHPDQLYMVTGRCDIKEPLDLAANSGLIVSVIKREDPMGNTARWFVDAGEVRGFLPAKNLSLVPQSSSGTSRLLRPNSAASVSSLGLSVASGTSNSSESLKEVLQCIEAEQPEENGENFYDLPPSYEEALGAEGTASPHRYCEIDDIIGGLSPTATGPAPLSPEKAESPIYADIEEILTSKGDLALQEDTSSGNNVYKVAYAFQQRTNLEITLVENELVTVLVKHDEADNPEWWLIENDAGVQGYAPAAYLTQLVPDLHA